MAEAKPAKESSTTQPNAGAAPVDMKFEIVVIPVSDVDRAKKFYTNLGWRLDADFDNGKDFRIVQCTPPGSGCSIIFGKKRHRGRPGSTQGLYLIVSDVQAARQALLDRGIEAAGHSTTKACIRALTRHICSGASGSTGLDPNHASYR